MTVLAVRWLATDDLCYNDRIVDTTIRNLDPQTYRRLKAHAALNGQTIGEVVNDALRSYLSRAWPASGERSLADWGPIAFPDGNERLSAEVDAIVYGDVKRSE